jgi:hypothetical protein
MEKKISLTSIEKAANVLPVKIKKELVCQDSKIENFAEIF